MYRNLVFLLALLTFLEGNMTSAFAENPLWPTLPTTGFIAGRPATQQDVADGNAVFSAEKDGKVIGVPLPIEIPEYAYWDDGKGHKLPVIVIQAERANGLNFLVFEIPKGNILPALGQRSLCSVIHIHNGAKGRFLASVGWVSEALPIFFVSID